jgi:hypothetical protein
MKTALKSGRSSTIKTRSIAKEPEGERVSTEQRSADPAQAFRSARSFAWPPSPFMSSHVITLALSNLVHIIPLPAKTRQIDKNFTDSPLSTDLAALIRVGNCLLKIGQRVPRGREQLAPT